MYARAGKRVLDVLLALMAIIVLLPVILIAAIAIVVDDGRPVLFSQRRVGQFGNLFRVYKFRSMKVDTKDIPSMNAPTDAITRVGRFLRRSNIDELPQLFNVLRGDMSIVGPRPPLPSQAVLLAERNRSGAINLRPGLTGLAQVNGYDGMSEEIKAGWDAKYAENVSFLRDVVIMFRTVGYLFRPPPVY